MGGQTFESLCRAGLLEVGDGYRAKNNELGGTGPIFLRSAYLQDNGFMLTCPERFISDQTVSFGQKLSRLGDVVITTKGNSTGRIGRIRLTEAGAVYSPHLSYWRSRSPAHIDQAFLYYWAASEEFRRQLAGMAHSTDMAPYLSLRDQARLKMSLPDISRQVGIGGILSALDDKIELNRRMNETLEASARALFRDWFVDFGPTRAKAEGRPAYLAPDLWSLFPDRLGDDDVPAGWRLGSLADLISISPKEPLKRDVIAPYLDMAALPTSGSTTDLPIDRVYSSGTRFRNGDTLLARITPCLENGKTGYVQNLPEDTVGWGSTEFIVLRTKPAIPSAVSYLVARDDEFRRHVIQSMTGTSGRQRANADAVARYPVVVPDGDELWQAFGTIVDPMFEQIASSERESRTLAETRDTLLPKLMSGAIRVREAESAVAALC
jgi:type I restriction enzyme S subunit